MDGFPSKEFPDYFKNFELPKEFDTDEFVVYRACRTCNLDRESFLNSYEEAGYMSVTLIKIILVHIPCLFTVIQKMFYVLPELIEDFIKVAIINFLVHGKQRKE